MKTQEEDDDDGKSGPAKEQKGVDSSENNSATEIEHRTVTAVITKTSIDQKLGIKIQHYGDGDFTISGLSADSPFQGSDLAVGMKVLSINNVVITGKSMDLVMTLLRSSVGDVTIEAYQAGADEDSQSLEGSV